MAENNNNTGAPPRVRHAWLVPVIVVVVLVVVAIIVGVLIWYFVFNVPSVVVVTLAPLDIALKSAYTAPNVDTRMLVTTWDMLPDRTYRLVVNNDAVKTGTTIPFSNTIEDAKSPSILTLSTPSEIAVDALPSDFEVSVFLLATAASAGAEYRAVMATSEPGQAFSACTNDTSCTQTKYCDIVSKTCQWSKDITPVALGIKSIYELIPSPRLVTSWPVEPGRTYSVTVSAAANALGTNTKYFPFVVLDAVSPIETIFKSGTQVSASAVPADFTVTVSTQTTATLPATEIGTTVATSGSGMSFSSCVTDADCVTTGYCDRTKKICGVLPAPTSLRVDYMLNPVNPTTVMLLCAMDAAGIALYPANAVMSLKIYKDSYYTLYEAVDLPISEKVSYIYNLNGAEDVLPNTFKVSVQISVPGVVGQVSPETTVNPTAVAGSAYGACDIESDNCNPVQCEFGKTVPYSLMNQSCGDQCCVSSTTCMATRVCLPTLATNRAMATGTFAQLRQDGQWQVFVTGNVLDNTILTRAYSIVNHVTKNNVIVVDTNTADNIVKLGQLSTVLRSPEAITNKLDLLLLRFRVVTTDLSTKNVDIALYPVFDLRDSKCKTPGVPCGPNSLCTGAGCVDCSTGYSPIVINTVRASPVLNEPKNVNIYVEFTHTDLDFGVVVNLYSSNYSLLYSYYTLPGEFNTSFRFPLNMMGLQPIVEVKLDEMAGCVPRSTSAITQCTGFDDPLKVSSAILISVSDDGKTPSRVSISVEPGKNVFVGSTIVISLSAQAKTVLDPVSIDSTETLAMETLTNINVVLSAPATFEILTVTMTTVTICGVRVHTIPVMSASALPACQLDQDSTTLVGDALYVTLARGSAIRGGADVSVQVRDSSNNSVGIAKLAISHETGEVTKPIYGQKNLVAPLQIVPFYSATTTPVLGNAVVPVICKNPPAVAPTDLIAVLENDTLNVAWKYFSTNKGFINRLRVENSDMDVIGDFEFNDVASKSAQFKINTEDARWYSEKPLLATLLLTATRCNDENPTTGYRTFQTTSPVTVVPPNPPPPAPTAVQAVNIIDRDALNITWGIPLVPPETGSVNVIELYNSTDELLQTYKANTLDCYLMIQTLWKPTKIVMKTRTPRGAWSTGTSAVISPHCIVTSQLWCVPEIKFYRDPDGMVVTIITPTEGVILYEVSLSNFSFMVQYIITKGGRRLDTFPDYDTIPPSYHSDTNSMMVYDQISQRYVYTFKQPDTKVVTVLSYNGCYELCNKHEQLVKFET
jgi:hypothetical protein